MTVMPEAALAAGPNALANSMGNAYGNSLSNSFGNALCNSFNNAFGNAFSNTFENAVSNSACNVYPNSYGTPKPGTFGSWWQSAVDGAQGLFAWSANAKLKLDLKEMQQKVQAADELAAPVTPLNFAAVAPMSGAAALSNAEVILQNAKAARASVARDLQQARASHDVVLVLCLNDVLNQLDASVGSIQSRVAQIRSAIGAGDTELIQHEVTILQVMNERVKQLSTSAHQCVGSTDETNSGTTSLTMDAQIPFPGSDNVELPPVSVPSTAVASPPLVRNLDGSSKFDAADQQMLISALKVLSDLFTRGKISSPAWAMIQSIVNTLMQSKTTANELDVFDIDHAGRLDATDQAALQDALVQVASNNAGLPAQVTTVLEKDISVGLTDAAAAQLIASGMQPSSVDQARIGFLNQQYQALTNQINAIATGTTFNGADLINGSLDQQGYLYNIEQNSDAQTQASAQTSAQAAMEMASSVIQNAAAGSKDSLAETALADQNAYAAAKEGALALDQTALNALKASTGSDQANIAQIVANFMATQMAAESIGMTISGSGAITEVMQPVTQPPTAAQTATSNALTNLANSVISGALGKMGNKVAAANLAVGLMQNLVPSGLPATSGQLALEQSLIQAANANLQNQPNTATATQVSQALTAQIEAYNAQAAAENAAGGTSIMPVALSPQTGGTSPAAPTPTPSYTPTPTPTYSPTPPPSTPPSSTPTPTPTSTPAPTPTQTPLPN
jgi:hypothetical protein